MRRGAALLTLGMVGKHRLQVVGINNGFHVLIQSAAFPTFDHYEYLVRISRTLPLLGNC